MEVLLIGGTNRGKVLEIDDTMTSITMPINATYQGEFKYEQYIKHIFHTSRKEFVLFGVNGLDDAGIVQILFDTYRK